MAVEVRAVSTRGNIILCHVGGMVENLVVCGINKVIARTNITMRSTDR